MKYYSLHYTSRREVKLPFDESGLVLTAESIVLLFMQGELLQGDFHWKFSAHVETPMERLIPTRKAQARQLN